MGFRRDLGTFVRPDAQAERGASARPRAAPARRASVWAALDSLLCVQDDAIAEQRGRAALGVPDLDWLMVVEEANRHFVTAALWSGIDRRGLAAIVPADACGYLTLVHAGNAARNERIRRQCLHIGDLLADAGLEAILLKGAGWLFDTCAGARHDRMMRDIDLLVAPATLGRAVAVLTQAGYHDTSASFAETGHFHHAPLVPSDGEAAVELHRHLAHRRRLPDWSDLRADASPVARGLLLPSRGHRIVHNVVHAQMENGDWSAGHASLRDTLDLARLTAGAPKDFDWAALAASARAMGLYTVLSGALTASHALLSMPMPAGFDGWRARTYAWRCTWQRRRPAVERAAQQIGQAIRALAWERDAYALPGARRLSLRDQIAVNARRLRRIGRFVRRQDM